MRVGVGKSLRSAIAPALCVGMLVTPAVAKAPELVMLDGLANASWDLHYRGDDTHEKICLQSGRELIQLRHRVGQCSRFVVDDGPSLVTVQYTCPGDGYGRTSIRRETSQVLQIDSQGIEGGVPFHLTAEARRIGAC